jgi:hypothetical protein
LHCNKFTAARLPNHPLPVLHPGDPYWLPSTSTTPAPDTRTVRAHAMTREVRTRRWREARDVQKLHAPFPLKDAPMAFAASIVIALVALLHAWFLVLEMFLWTRPSGRRAFGLSEAFAEESRVLAANQGLYNGFLAAGLAWGLWQGGRRRPAREAVFPRLHPGGRPIRWAYRHAQGALDPGGACATGTDPAARRPVIVHPVTPPIPTRH